MLAGQPPFTGPSFERMIYQHLVEVAPPVTRFRPTVPAAIAAALNRALAKSPTDRFSTTAAFADAVRTRLPERANARWVAGWPFANLSADPENEYFADGITEDVIAQISKIRALKAISSGSVLGFQNRAQHPKHQD